MIEYENLKKVNQAFTDEYCKAFKEVLDSGWFILGEKVSIFEREFALYNNSQYCIGVANGLDALNIALRILNFEKGSEVLVPSNTYIATILAIVQNGLQPILVEPDINTYNIDSTLLEQHITHKTKCIMPVHLYGKVCDMDAISYVADKYHLAVIEDCAQAHGAKFKNRKAGTFGNFGAFSFYPTKNLGALADAGALTTNIHELDKATRQFRNYGSQKKYYNEVVGVNSRLDEVQAAFLSIKLKALDAINAHKRALAETYIKYLKDDFIKPFVHTDYFDVYHIFTVRHPKRDQLKQYLESNEIKTEIHYPVAPNKQKAMVGIIDHYDTPVAQQIHNTTLSLPISYFHTQEDILKVIEIMNKF